MKKGSLLQCILGVFYLVQAYVKFNSSSNEAIKFSTISLFHERVSPFNVAGPAIELLLGANEDDKNCTISSNLTKFDPENAILANTKNPHTITILDYPGSPCFFNSIADVSYYLLVEEDLI